MSLDAKHRGVCQTLGTTLLQVDRLKPRFRQFILDRCTRSHPVETSIRNTPLRGRMTDVHGSWSARRGQELGSARRSLTSDSGDPVPRPTGMADCHIEEGTFPNRNRMKEIRRRIVGMGARGPAMGSMGPIQDTLPGVASSRVHQANETMERCDNFFSFWHVIFLMLQARCVGLSTFYKTFPTPSIAHLDMICLCTQAAVYETDHRQHS